MQVFTYCSCRSSRYGYQYATFSSDSNETISSILSSEMSEHSILGEFIKWCENKNGWQFVIEQVANKEKYLIMVGQLEKSRELKKKEEKIKGNLNLNENSFDSDFYMTLGFLGSISEIKPIAIYLLKAYKKDGFFSLFNILEATISKSDDATRYKIDTTQFNEIFRNCEPIFSIESQKTRKNKIISLAVRKLKPDPYVRLTVESAKIKKERLRKRKDNIEECAKLLKNMENFSEHILLIIAYNYFTIRERVNVHIEYEYLC